jgi:hypothetical protein
MELHQIWVKVQQMISSCDTPVPMESWKQIPLILDNLSLIILTHVASLFFFLYA